MANYEPTTTTTLAAYEAQARADGFLDENGFFCDVVDAPAETQEPEVSLV